MIKPSAVYAVVELAGKILILASARVAALEALLGQESRLIGAVSAEQLLTLQVQHPFDSARQVPVLGEESVGLEDGTAVVHMAPGAGPLDYEVGVRNGIEVYSPVDAAGCYTAQVIPATLSGLKVADVHGTIITD